MLICSAVLALEFGENKIDFVIIQMDAKFVLHKPVTQITEVPGKNYFYLFNIFMLK